MSVGWILRLPDSENDLENSLQGRGGIVFFGTGSRFSATELGTRGEMPSQ